MAMKKASEGSGIVWCHDSGSACIAFAEEATIPEKLTMFARVEPGSPVYDPALDELSQRLTQLTDAVQPPRQKREIAGAETQLGFLRTGAGFLPVWKREVSSTERLEDLVDVDGLTDLDAMTVAQRDSYLGLREEDSGDWRAYSVSGGVYTCKGAGEGCFVTVEALSAEADDTGSMKTVTYFPTVGEDSPVYDRALGELADRLNAAINEVQAQAANSATERTGKQVGLTITDRGLLPVWKSAASDDDKTGDGADRFDLEAMTETERQAFLQVK
jgi:hypothetical protein